MTRFCILSPAGDSYQLLNATTYADAVTEAAKYAEDYGYTGTTTIHRALTHKEFLTENGDLIINSLDVAQSIDEQMYEETGCESCHFTDPDAMVKEINSAVLEIALRHAIDDVSAYFTAAPLTTPEIAATEAA